MSFGISMLLAPYLQMCKYCIFIISENRLQIFLKYTSFFSPTSQVPLPDSPIRLSNDSILMNRRLSTFYEICEFKAKIILKNLFPIRESVEKYTVKRHIRPVTGPKMGLQSKVRNKLSACISFESLYSFPAPLT